MKGWHFIRYDLGYGPAGGADWIAGLPWPVFEHWVRVWSEAGLL